MEVSESPSASPQPDQAIAGTATVLLLIGMPIGWLGSNTSTGDAIGFVVATAISLAPMAAVFAFVGLLSG
jgi:hypothetical protein